MNISLLMGFKAQSVEIYTIFCNFTSFFNESSSFLLVYMLKVSVNKSVYVEKHVTLS